MPLDANRIWRNARLATPRDGVNAYGVVEGGPIGFEPLRARVVAGEEVAPC